VDVDENKPLAKSFEVSSIPAVMFIPIDGEPVMTIGSRDKAKFEEQINTILLGK
jgi:thioredoxin-like negative regulator of GroEL